MKAQPKENLPLYLFHQGTNYRAYDFMGSHFDTVDGKKGVTFRVWAPKAQSVSVVGDFNGWNKDLNPMKRVSDGGVFETFIADLKVYDNYKYAVTSEKGTVLKADPYAFHSETPSETSSKIYDINGYKWKDEEYINKRNTTSVYSSPMNIYEVNAGSWKRNENGSYYSYRQLADTLVPYVKEMGYTHIEFMPLTEYPFDGSWGYQVTGYFAATSRFGTPFDLMYLIDKCHQNDISVILDWVPAHFPKDEYGLYEFDGHPCYENQGWDRMEHKGWGTRIFDWGRNEVQSFLISSAMFFFDKYHIDGLRVDAVASMLYLDYDRKPGEWIPNVNGGNYNLEAIAFFKKLNSTIFGNYPYALMIAEESTSFPMVTKPTNIGGLGFNYKWNMGWMNDILSYMQTDPYFRRDHHNELTFSMCYAFSENYILPISHDEVVHGKKSLLDKMPGNYEEKFMNMRAFLGYMYSHPGKKLLFMGSEYGQFREWAFEEGLEFFMTDYELHKKMQDYVKAINNIYKSQKPFYEIEDRWDGFEWILTHESAKNIISFLRRDKSGKEIVVVINFSGCTYNNFRLGVNPGTYKIILNSDAKIFGGDGIITKNTYKTSRISSNGKNTSILLNIPKLSAIYLERTI